MTFAAVLGVLYYADRLDVAPILVLAFLTGLAQSQSAPTYQAVLTTVVPPAQIPNAVALNSLQFNLSRMIGPAIAGRAAPARRHARLLRGERASRSWP